MNIKCLIRPIATALVAMLSVSLIAQTNDDKRTEGYLFAQFMPTKVKFLNGAVYNERTNYHLAAEKLHFIAANGEVQEVTNAAEIEFFAIGERQFFMQGSKVYERLCADPEVYANYRCDARQQAHENGFGAKSETSSVKSVGAVYEGTGRIALSDGKFVFSDVKIEYKLRMGGALKKFSNLKGFVKLFKKEQREAIEQYAHDNNVNFSDTSQVVQLCRFAKSL